MPEVVQEEPITEGQAYEALAHKLGIEDFNYDYEQGLDPGTYVFKGNIPPKYIKVLNKEI
jgi:hypothetical protein